MKKLSLVLFLPLFLAFSSNLSAQCGSVVDQACVGACSPTAVLSYQVPPVVPSLDNKLCLDVTSYSLCANTIAIAVLYVNGSPVAKKLLRPNSFLSIPAQPGDDITVKIYTRFIGGGIYCVWLGEVQMDLLF